METLLNNPTIIDQPDIIEEEEKEHGDGPKDFQFRITAIRNATEDSSNYVVKTNKKGLCHFICLIILLF